MAATGRTVRIEDGYRLPEDSPYQISRSWDEKSGYRTKSMLVVPMRDHENAVIGVVQLINKKRDRDAMLQPLALVDEQVIPFTEIDEELAGSLASQAAVAFENADLIRRIQDAVRDLRPRGGGRRSSSATPPPRATPSAWRS